MIDLHSHLLANIDDGSRSVERSGAVLRAMALEGVRDLVLTPHLRASAIESRGEASVGQRAAAFLELQERIAEPPVLHLGFEIMLDQPLPVLATGDRRFALAGSRYYLVEFPLTVSAASATAVLERITRSGAVPLVAHPERYDQCSPYAVTQWRAVGAKVQLDATTLTRPTRRGYRARQLLAAGLADVVAADNHGDRRSVSTARRYLELHGYPDAAVGLTEANPRAVLDDAEMREVPAAPIRESLLDRVRRFIG